MALPGAPRSPTACATARSPSTRRVSTSDSVDRRSLYATHKPEELTWVTINTLCSRDLTSMEATYASDQYTDHVEVEVELL